MTVFKYDDAFNTCVKGMVGCAISCKGQFKLIQRIKILLRYANLIP